MEKLVEQFLEHLRYERNVSAHTLRNYSSDLEQFLDHLDPLDQGDSRPRNLPEVTEIDHLTIREWLAALHTAQKKKASVARKLAALRTFFQFLVREGIVELNRSSWQRRVWRRSSRRIFQSKRRLDLSNRRISKRI
jgi:integrase/recombinase XerC